MRNVSYRRRGLGSFLGIVFLVAAVAPSGLTHAQSPFRIERVSSNQRYQIRELKPYAFAYVDREYVFTRIPSCLQHQAYVVTANSDKFSRGNTFLAITSQVHVTVYVGYDTRYRDSVPEWLQQRFQPVPNLNMAIGNPNSPGDLVTYQFYRGRFAPGIIELGGNLAASERRNYAMYTIVLAGLRPDTC